MNNLRLKKLLAAVIRWLYRLIGVYAAVALVYLCLRVFVGERWDIVALVNMVGHVLVIPAPLLLIVCLLGRRWRMSALLLPTTLAFVVMFGVFFIPRSIDVPMDAPHLSLLTYNTRFERTNLDPQADLIEHAAADVVLMQEVSFYAAEYIGQRLLEQYPYQVFYPASIHAGGVGVMSRYPIRESDYWGTTRYQQRVLLDVDGRQVVIYNVHTRHPFVEGGTGLAQRREEVQDIIARATQETVPVILGGDFNITEQSDEYHWLTTHFSDAYRVVGQGFGFTFPAVGANIRFFRMPFAIARLDYVFYNADIQATAAMVWPESGSSDHQPVRVELALIGDS